MTKPSPSEALRELQIKCQKLKPRLARQRLTRVLSRNLNIHPNSLANYLDGFCSDPVILNRIIEESEALLSKVSV
mgnify:CR=1 FL=1